MKKLALALALGASTASFAQTTVETDPVGFVNVDVPGGADGIISLPLSRAPVLETTVASVAGNVVSLNATLNAGSFVFDGTTVTDHFFLQVKEPGNSSTIAEGVWFEITNNDASSVTVDSGSPLDVQTQGLIAGDRVVVVPFWTLGTLFPGGEGVDPTDDGNSIQGQVIMMPQSTAGTDLSGEKTFIYYTGPGLTEGFYDTGSGLESTNAYFVPDSFLILRNPGSQKSISLVGSVPMSDVTTNIGTILANTAQDNLVVNPLPIPLTLQQLNLFESGAFTPTTDFNQLQDQLLLYDNAAVGEANPARSLIYWTGGQSLANGWYDTGSGLGPLDNTEIVQPGRGFIVRKPGETNPSSVTWTIPASYAD